MRVWRLKNPESARSHGAKNRAKRRSAEGTYTKSDVSRLLILQGRKCAECKKNLSDKYHVDHIMPLARGGSNWPTNLQILCQSCNQSKHARDPFEWARSKGRLL
ncbi:HNH endonuclease [Agrobacterium tumefaciens]|uniref:HNH endonuclease n=1 Tax=Agrobacterium tumefaciens TaxID=358 RepID=UPI003969D4F6